MPVVTIEVDGVPATVRVAGLSVRDNLNDAPNTCSLILHGSEAPVDGQDLRITLDTPRLLFAGTLQTVDQTYQGRPVTGAWPCRGIDYTARLNYRRPFGTWVEVSATTVATDLVTTFAPTFSTTFIEAGLPDITITCDGSEDLIGALGRIAVLIGGYCKVEDLDVYLFLTDTTDPPDPVQGSSPYPAGVLADGAEAYWRLESGLPVVDETGNGHTGTLASAIGMVYGLPGVLPDTSTGISFDGTQVRAALTPFALGTTYTVEAWVTGGAGTYGTVISQTTGTRGLYWHNGGATVRFNWFDTTDHFNATNLSAGVLYHVVFSVTAGVGTWYINGVADGTSAVPSTFTPAWLFNDSANTRPLIATLVDEIAVYPTALSAAKVAARYAQHTTLTYPTLLNDPPVRCSIDDSQLRTRVYGKGHAEAVTVDVVSGETNIPLADTSMYIPSGGQVIAGTTPDGAASEILTYTGVQAGGDGTLIGPGASPSSGPTLLAVDGGGGTVDAGVHLYAVSFVTASGESLAAPTASVTTGGTLTPPAAALTYVSPGAGFLGVGYYGYAFTYITASGETTRSPRTEFHANGNGLNLANLLTGPVNVTSRKVYRTVVQATAGAAATAQLKLAATIANNTATTLNEGLADGSLGANIPTSNTATLNQVAISGVPIGGATVTQRKIYRTVAGGSTLKLQQTIANNTATVGVQDQTADGSLGANAPGADTSLLTQPNGTVLAGSTSVVVAGAAAFSASGGWATVAGGQTIRYTGISSNTLTGVPATGPGAITATLAYNSTIVAAPELTGVTGLTKALAKGSPVHIWVQRDDLVAQADAATRESTGSYTSDGIHEHLITDARRGEASLIARCDADLVLFAQPIVTYTYATRDVKTKSGKTVHIELPGYPVGDYVIQDVTIDQIDIATGLAPRFLVKASSVAFSLEDVLRRLTTQLGPV